MDTTPISCRYIFLKTPIAILIILDNLPPKVGSASSAHLRRVNNPKKRKRQVEDTGIHHTRYRGTRNAGIGKAEIADNRGGDRLSQSFRHSVSDGRHLDLSNTFRQRGEAGLHMQSVSFKTDVHALPTSFHFAPEFVLVMGPAPRCGVGKI